MNTPNKLTLLRMMLVPVVMAFTLWEGFSHHYLVAGLLFLAAAITDILDGKIARRYGLVTNFGKLMDPVADKLLVCASLICFVRLDVCSAWILFVVLAREFLVTSVRLVAAGDGKVIAANAWGKWKTVSQSVAVVAVYVFLYFQELIKMSVIPQGPVTEFLNASLLSALGSGFLWISAVLTLISGAVYIGDNRGVFSEKES